MHRDRLTGLTVERELTVHHSIDNIYIVFILPELQELLLFKVKRSGGIHISQKLSFSRLARVWINCYARSILYFAAWGRGKKRSVIIVRPDKEDNRNNNDNNNDKGDDVSGSGIGSGSGSGSSSGEDDGESSGASEQVRASQRSEIAKVETRGERLK